MQARATLAACILCGTVWHVCLGTSPMGRGCCKGGQLGRVQGERDGSWEVWRVRNESGEYSSAISSIGPALQLICGFISLISSPGHWRKHCVL